MCNFKVTGKIQSAMWDRWMYFFYMKAINANFLSDVMAFADNYFVV